MTALYAKRLSRNRMHPGLFQGAKTVRSVNRSNLLGVVIVVFSHPLWAAQLNEAVQLSDVEKLLRCRVTTDAMDRLACLDSAAAAIERSMQTGELQVLSREVIEQAGKSSFGRSESGLAVIGVEEPSELPGTIRTARATPDGWVVLLEDGSTWRQIDSRTSAVDPKAGQAVVIKRAALGSYRLMLNERVGFKVRRTP